MKRFVFYEFSGYKTDDSETLSTSIEDLGLTPAELRKLDEFSKQIATDGVFRIGQSSITARQYVGVVTFGSFQFEILPKILKVPNGAVNSTLENLMWMLHCCPEIWPLPTMNAEVRTGEGSFLDIAILHFSKTVCLAASQGIPQLYVAREEILSQPRGRIDFVQNVRSNPADLSKHICRFDEITTDHIFMRAIRHVLKIFKPLARSADAKNSVAEALSRIENGADRGVNIEELMRTSVPRGNPSFTAAVELAKMALRNLRHEATDGASSGIGIVFDMNEVFEAYFASVLARRRQELGIQELRIQRRRALTEAIIDLTEGKRIPGSIATFTDIWLKLNSGHTLVIDTKYKNIGSQLQQHAGVSTADAYQILAYQSIFNPSDASIDGALIYPESVRPLSLRFDAAGGKRWFLKTISVSRNLRLEEHVLTREIRIFFDIIEATKFRQRAG